MESCHSRGATDQFPNRAAIARHHLQVRNNRRTMFENGVFALRLNGFLERTTRAVKPPARPDWVHEIKHDGCPLVVLFTRRGDRPCPGGGYTAIHSALPPGLSWSNTNVSRRQPASNRFTPRTRRA